MRTQISRHFEKDFVVCEWFNLHLNLVLAGDSFSGPYFKSINLGFAFICNGVDVDMDDLGSFALIIKIMKF